MESFPLGDLDGIPARYVSENQITFYLYLGGFLSLSKFRSSHMRSKSVTKSAMMRAILTFKSDNIFLLR